MSSLVNNTRQKGLSYVEVLLSLIILAVAILPALDSIRSGIQAAVVHEEIIVDHYSLVSKMQEVKSTAFEDLLAAADAAGSFTNASSYSDDSGVEPRHLVFLSYYDADNGDSDDNLFTILDSNTDSDNNPYTSDASEPLLSLLWVSVELESSIHSLQTLVLR